MFATTWQSRRMILMRRSRSLRVHHPSSERDCQCALPRDFRDCATAGVLGRGFSSGESEEEEEEEEDEVQEDSEEEEEGERGQSERARPRAFVEEQVPGFRWRGWETVYRVRPRAYAQHMDPVPTLGQSANGNRGGRLALPSGVDTTVVSVLGRDRTRRKRSPNVEGAPLVAVRRRKERRKLTHLLDIAPVFSSRK